MDEAKKTAQGKINEASDMANKQISGASGLVTDQMKKLGIAGAEQQKKKPPIVIKGQWVKNEEGKDLIMFDPTEQEYEVIWADRKTQQLTKFDQDDDDD